MADEQQMGAQDLATPSNPLAEATVAFLRDRFPDAMLEAAEHRGEMTIVVKPERIAEVCLALRDEKNLAYNYLADITAVDWPEREPRYDIVYHLLSLGTYAVVRLKTRIGGEDDPDPEIATVTTVWPGANWFEREIYDLFGIRFTGHPNQTRILMPQDWVGHPLRKDYPLTGIQLPEPHWGGQVLLEQPLPEDIGQQTLRTPDGAEGPQYDNTTAGASDSPDSPESPDSTNNERAR